MEGGILAGYPNILDLLCKMANNWVGYESTPKCYSTKPVSHSVPDAPCTMMWDCFLSPGLHVFHQIVQKEVYQDGIDFDFWVVPLDLPPDEFDTPDTASYPAPVCQPRLPGSSNKAATYLSSASPSYSHLQEPASP
jgi:hypothetical protein